MENTNYYNQLLSKRQSINKKYLLSKKRFRRNERGAKTFVANIIFKRRNFSTIFFQINNWLEPRFENFIDSDKEQAAKKVRNKTLKSQKGVWWDVKGKEGGRQWILAIG